jgi:hypothetical protein
MPRAFLAVVLLLLASGRALPAQGVLVAPHAIYLDHRTRSGEVMLYNPGAQPVEVSVSFLFGYAVTDSVGRFTLFTPDSATPDSSHARSAAGWIEAFPRRMTLGPLQRQTVRLLGRPPADLADGEYWARLVVSASGGSVPVTGADTAGISVGLNLEIRTIIPLSYRKGALSTAVTLAGLRAEPAGDSLSVRARLTRGGAAAYIGVARGSLADSTGRVVGRFEEPVAVYYTVDPEFTLPIRGLPAGTYRLRIELASERPDIDPKILLHAVPVRDSLTLALP